MFLQDQLQAIASYTGQTLDLIAFLVGLVFVFSLFLLIAYVMIRFGKQALSAPMDLFLFALGIAIVTFLGWWTAWILIAMILVGVFAIVFLPNGMGSSVRGVFGR